MDYGAFGENLVIEGFDFRKLPVTSRFAIGDVVLEMTQIGKECHNDCVIKQKKMCIRDRYAGWRGQAGTGGYPDLRGIPAPCRSVCPVRGLSLIHI